MSQKKQVVGIGPFKELIASGVRVGDILTISGQVGIDAEGNSVGAGDVCQQARQAYINLQEVLVEFGVSGDCIMDETWFVTDMEEVMSNVEKLIAIRQEILGSKTRDISHTLVQVAGLVEPDLSIEIKCIAHV